MSDAISVECPQCHAKLKLKSRSAVGKKVPCPKCKKPFVVTAPPDDEDELGFLNVAEPEADEFAGLADEGGDEDEFPAAPMARSKQRGKKKSGGSSSDSDMTKWLMVATGSLVAVGLLIAAGIFGIPLLAGWLASSNKIDTAWLPPDADLIVHSRLADTWGSPFVQSIVSMPAIKPQLDLTWSKLGIDPSKVSSITVGASGAAAKTKEIAMRGPMGMAGGPGGATPSAPVPFVVVVRTRAIEDLSKIKEKFKNGRTGTHQGMEYLVPPIGGDIALYFADGETLVTGTEQNVKQAIEWGRKGVRRPDLDFIDPTQMVLIALVPKDPSLLDTPPMTGRGAPSSGFSQSLTEAMRGKVKGICIGLSATDKLEWTIASNCNDGVAADAVLKATEKSLEETKSNFATFKASAPPLLSEMVQLGDAVIGSMQISASGDVISTRGSVPASIKSTIEKLPLFMLMGGGMGGQNPAGSPGTPPFAPPGAPGEQGFSIPADGQLPPGSIPPGNPSLGNPPPGTPPQGGFPPNP